MAILRHRRVLVLVLVLAACRLPAQKPLAHPATAASMAIHVQIGNTQALRNQADQLFAMANQARAAQGLRVLQWDPALAAAALNHCARMAAEGQISHQYGGEPDLSERAGQSGAHFRLIEENVAVGASPASIHQAWMNSMGHRENLLNAEIDRVGIAVVARGNGIYAVADYAHSVAVLTNEQVEAKVAHLMQASGVAVGGNTSGARQACTQDHGLPVSLGDRRPEFIMRWQDAELARLPEALLDRIATGRYREAAVGSCAPQTEASTFTVYRVAVMLLRPDSTGSRTLLSSK